ncbi:hypothetical protein C2E23DRAFT_451478 [Lenzites betulinus]|nr:hypothetical protein C2E23DRAFT_451478 [Lenzites betulinus]
MSRRVVESKHACRRARAACSATGIYFQPRKRHDAAPALVPHSRRGESDTGRVGVRKCVDVRLGGGANGDRRASRKDSAMTASRREASAAVHAAYRAQAGR